MNWKLFAFPIVFTGTAFAGIYSFLHFTEKVDSKLNTHKFEPLLLNSSSSQPSIWRNQYHFQGKFVIFPFAISSNMYLFELPSENRNEKEFLIYNPTCLTPELKQNLENLLNQHNGKLKYMIIGTISHDLFFEEYLKHYPNLQVFCAPNSKIQLSKSLKEKNLESRLQEVRVDNQTGYWESSTNNLGKEHAKDISLYYLHGTEGSIQEMVMIDKTNQFLAVADSAHYVLPNKTFVTKENEDSTLSTIYAKYSGVYNKFAVHRILGGVVKNSIQLKKVLETIVEKEEISSIGMAHGEPILNEPFVKMAWYQNWVKVLPSSKSQRRGTKKEE